jgi:hypothetical protein
MTVWPTETGAPFNRTAAFSMLLKRMLIKRFVGVVLDVCTAITVLIWPGPSFDDVRRTFGRGAHQTANAVAVGDAVA